MLYFTWICKWLEKNTHFRLWKIQNGGKKIKCCWIYTRLFLIFLVSSYENWQEIIQTSRNSTGWFTALRWSLPSLPAQLGVSRQSQKNRKAEPLQHVITSYCRLANIYWLWHISTAGHLLANPDLCLNIHVIYLYWQVQTKHDCDGNQKYHLSKSRLLPESILFSTSNITI